MVNKKELQLLHYYFRIYHSLIIEYIRTVYYMSTQKDISSNIE